MMMMMMMTDCSRTVSSVVCHYLNVLHTVIGICLSEHCLQLQFD